MQRLGRQPLATGHVRRLYGSARAKERLTAFLDTLRGDLKIADAAQQLKLSESRFHELRHQWLQRALEQLEPQRLGRPPHLEDPAELARECARLGAEVEQLREQLKAAELREEVARILAEPAPKKTNRPLR